MQHRCLWSFELVSGLYSLYNPLSLYHIDKNYKLNATTCFWRGKQSPVSIVKQNLLNETNHHEQLDLLFTRFWGEFVAYFYTILLDLYRWCRHKFVPLSSSNTHMYRVTGITSDNPEVSFPPGMINSGQ